VGESQVRPFPEQNLMGWNIRSINFGVCYVVMQQMKETRSRWTDTLFYFVLLSVLYLCYDVMMQQMKANTHALDRHIAFFYYILLLVVYL